MFSTLLLVVTALIALVVGIKFSEALELEAIRQEEEGRRLKEEFETLLKDLDNLQKDVNTIKSRRQSRR